MAELFIFNQDQEFITTITEEDGLISAPFREEINQIPETPFQFTIKADSEVANYVLEENHVVFRDKEGELRLYVIKEVDDEDGEDGPYTTAICFPSWVEELKENIIEDRRILNKEAQEALNIALLGTRYVGEVEVPLGLNSTNFYYISSVEAVWNILSTWGGEVKDVVQFDDMNNIIVRKIKILQRRGADRGKRFEIDHDIQIINRTVLSYPVTALYGHGASLPTEDGGYTRYIDFGNVEWSVANGDPVDKPLGQKWVGDPEALAKYGRLHNGQRIHRKGKVSNYEIEDPAELLQWTWEQLKNATKPEIRYRMSVILLESFKGYEHEKVELGDTAIAIDRKFSRPIEIQTRVIAIEYDLLDIEGTAVVEMGQFLSVHQENLYREIEDLRERINRPIPPVTNESYPNIKPSIPTNVQAVGGFKVNQLYWDYDPNVYISHYEVYGSQVEGFVPDTQHLLWRGRAGSFTHEVNTEEVWYYRVRVVNTHGTASDFSEEVSASSVRIISDDILFGEDLALRLQELSSIAPLLAEGSITFEYLSDDLKDLSGTRIKGDLISIDGTTYIAEGVIGTAAIANGAITKAKMGVASVGTLQVEDGSITNAKIANLAVDDAKIANVKASKIIADELSAISANLGTVTAGLIRGVTFEGGIIDGAIIRASSYFHFMPPDSNTAISMLGSVDYGTPRLGSLQVSYYNSSTEVPDELIRVFPNAIEYAGLSVGDNFRIVFSPYNILLEHNLRVEGNGSFTGGLSIDGALTSYGANFYGTVNLNGKSIDRVYSIKVGLVENDPLGDAHLYLKPSSGGEIRVIQSGTSGTYRPIRASNFYSTGSSSFGGGVSVNGDVSITGGYVKVNAIDHNGAGEHLYIRPLSSGEGRCTAIGTTTTYRPFRASSFPTSSLAEYKEDIHEWKESALELIRNTSIYEYRLKDEVARGIDRPRQGLVIGEGYNTPEGVVDGDGIEQYLMNTWSWKAIQELDATQQEILADINWLKMENQLLKQKVNELEAKVA